MIEFNNVEIEMVAGGQGFLSGLLGGIPGVGGLLGGLLDGFGL